MLSHFGCALEVVSPVPLLERERESPPPSIMGRGGDGKGEPRGRLLVLSQHLLNRGDDSKGKKGAKKGEDRKGNGKGKGKSKEPEVNYWLCCCPCPVWWSLLNLSNLSLLSIHESHDCVASISG